MDDRSLYQCFQQAAARFGDAIAVRDGTRDLTFGSLEKASREVGAALIGLGIAKGDRVAIWGVNSADWIVAALGIQAAGAVLVPIGTRLRGREVQGILVDAQVRIVFCDRGFGNFSFAEALLGLDLPDLVKIVVLDEDGTEAGPITSIGALRTAGRASDEAFLDARIAQGRGTDLADIIFTSGTTGRPKGVPMTHAQSLWACRAQYEEINRFAPGDVFAVSYPFAHNAGYRAGWQVALLYGTRVIPVRAFDPAAMLRLIETERVTFLPVAPTVARAILDHPDRPHTDLSSIGIISTGAAMIPVKLIEDLRAAFSPHTIVQTSYGLTEAAGSVSTTRADDPPHVVAVTVGTALASLTVKILDADGNEVPAGTVGEIAVKGQQVLHGYYNNPAATAAAFTADGFLLTGDAGKMDARGYISITDRIKDMYLVGGFNCYPAEIEHLMRTMPGLRDVAVVGIDDERMGQVGRAFVVPEHGVALTEAQVIAWCRNEMANYKVPRSVRFLDALPLNATGKVAKVELRAQT